MIKVISRKPYHLLSRSSGCWNRSTASWSAPALTLLSTALGGRLGRLPARTTEALLIYPRFPRFAQLMPAAAPARNAAPQPALWKIRPGPSVISAAYAAGLPMAALDEPVETRATGTLSVN